MEVSPLAHWHRWGVCPKETANKAFIWVGFRAELSHLGVQIQKFSTGSYMGVLALLYIFWEPQEIDCATMEFG